MLSCAKNRKYLNAYLDDELPERMRQVVEKHLAECSTCSLELDELQRLEKSLTNFDIPQAPAWLSTRILTEAAYRQKRKEAPTTVGWGWREFLFQPWLVRWATATALVVGLVVGTWMSWTSYRNTDSEQWMSITNNNDTGGNFYAFDVLSAEPRGSIEAATLDLLEDGR